MNRNFAGNIGIGGKALNAGDPLMSDLQVAEHLGVGRSTVWRWAQDEVIPKPIKLGGATRWRLSWIENAISQAEAQAA